MVVHILVEADAWWSCAAQAGNVPICPTPGLVELLDDQAGVARLDQLRERGMSRAAVRAHVDAGRWERVFIGVYATLSGPLPRKSELWAAVLACGPGAVLSHESAAECHGLQEPVSGSVVHVTVPVTRRVVAQDGIRVHYLLRLPEARHPTLSPPRLRIEDTVLGLTDAALSGEIAMALVLRACQRRLTVPDRLSAAMARRKKMRWRTMLEGALDDARGGVQSLLERRYLYRVERAHGLPAGERQLPGMVNGRRVWRDVYYRGYRTLVELDGRLGHEGDGRLHDLRRDNAATVHGDDTLRFGWPDVTDTACRAAEQVALVLARNGWIGEPRSCGRGCTLRWPRSGDHEDAGRS